MSRPLLPFFGFLLILSCCLSACDQKPEKAVFDEVQVFHPAELPEVPEEAMANFKHPPISAMENMEQASQDPAVAATLAGSVSHEGISWRTPEGWVEKPGTTMRLASFEITSAQGVGDGSLVSLSGPAGGLEANVSRWMGQFSLSLPEGVSLSQFLENQQSVMTEEGKKVLVIDFTPLQPQEGNLPAVMAGVLRTPERTLFVKLTGPQALVLENRDKFKQLCESLKIA